MAIIFCRNEECDFCIEGRCDAEIVKMLIDSHGNNICETGKNNIEESSKLYVFINRGESDD